MKSKAHANRQCTAAQGQFETCRTSISESRIVKVGHTRGAGSSLERPVPDESKGPFNSEYKFQTCCSVIDIAAERLGVGLALGVCRHFGDLFFSSFLQLSLAQNSSSPLPSRSIHSPRALQFASSCSPRAQCSAPPSGDVSLLQHARWVRRSITGRALRIGLIMTDRVFAELQSGCPGRCWWHWSGMSIGKYSTTSQLS